MTGPRDFAAELAAAREVGDWDAHARVWDERSRASVEADEAALREDVGMTTITPDADGGRDAGGAEARLRKFAPDPHGLYVSPVLAIEAADTIAELLAALEEYMACVAFATNPALANADILTLREASDRMRAARIAAEEAIAIAKARGQ